MSKNNNSSTRFSIPLSAIPVIAFLVALEMILTRFLSINTAGVRIGFGFLPIALIAILYGPVLAGVAYALGDIVGALLFPTGAYFPGFTLSALLAGLTYGLFLYRKPISLKNVLPASLIVCILVNLLLDTFWLYVLMGQGVLAYIPARILKTAIMIPLQVIIIPLVWNKLIARIPSIQERA